MQNTGTMDDSLIQKATKAVVADAGLTERATCYTFRHSFATHLLEAVPSARFEFLW